METRSDFRITAIAKKGVIGAVLRIIGPAVDRVFGIRRLRLIYERGGLAGLDKYAFIERFTRVLGIESDIDTAELERIPKEGPVVLIANHPLGGLEGILLASILKAVRPDYKIFANVMLSFVSELRDFFIFTNPMLKGGRQNFGSIAEASRWLKAGHLLLIFPAGRVGLYRADKGYVTDEPWDLVGLSLGLKAKAVFVPLFVEGTCSRTFSILSRFVFPMKLLMLVREFISSFDKRVAFAVGRPLDGERLAGFGKRRANAWLRMRTYLLAPLRGGIAPLRDEIALRDARNDIDARGGGAPSGRPMRSGRMAISPAGGGAYGLKTAEVIKAALIAQGRGRGQRTGKKARYGRLHPEVTDYIDRYGLSDAELVEIVAALEGEAKGTPRAPSPIT